MKYKIEMKKNYKRNLKLMHRQGKNINLLNYVINELANGHRLDAKYNDHKLQGKYKDCRECHIEPDWLLIYKIEHNTLILTLTNTGTHSDLY
ncbi:MAG: type II toxin-antitoxin system YafQ family toxin [Bacteroidetes bacterium]|nr:type II toxin-antitoxin system YafQ family toxin [Bacteroidota bacterium]